MDNRTKRDLAIVNLIADFEDMLANGESIFLGQNSYQDIIEYYEEDGQLKKALTVIDLAILNFSNVAEFYLKKANILRGLNRPKECLSALDEVEKIAPQNMEAKYLRIKVFAYLGKIEEAEEIISMLSVHANNNEKTDLYICESYIYEVTQEYHQMYDVLKKAIIGNPENQEALDRFWFSIEFSKNYYSAIEFLTKVIDKTPYSYMSWYNLGQAYSCVGEYKKAIFSLEYAFIIQPEFQSAYLECAELCLQIMNYAKALDIYKEALERFGLDEEILLNMAECQKEMGNIAGAKYNLYKALKYDPYNDEVYYKLGKCHALEKNWNSAIKAYHKAITIEEHTEDYYFDLAEAYFAMGSYEKADFFYRKATTIAPEESFYWAKYASFLIKTNETALALQLLRKAEDFTFGADLLYCKSVALLLNNDEEAYVTLQEALEEDIDLHPMIFTLEPELALDEKLNSMINYFKE